MSYEFHVYCAVVYHRVICIVCLFCGGLASCHMYGFCIVWCLGSMS